MPQHLHLKFAVNLETLADEMIEEISKAWKSPLDAPIVIFSEYKVEQWFRLHWIEKKGVLANLNRKSLDRFLMDILVGDDPTKKKLTSDMLRNVILAYLQKTGEDDIPNYKTLDERVSEYLVDPLSGAVDENRLFDFANKLSGLFLEYETSRPGDFLSGVDGFLDCWKQGALKDFFLSKTGKPVENEVWERKLYSAIFHNENGDSLLTKVFKAAAKDSDQQVEYLTLPFLYHMSRQGGKMEFHYDSKQPVFILGLSGMGQFYRVVLQEFAKEHDVYAYIQNPCMEFWEDIEDSKVKRDIRPSYSAKEDPDSDVENDLAENENTLLVNWGRAGRDNIKLWSLADDYQEGFDEDVKSLYEKEKDHPGDTLLHQLQWMIAHRKNVFSDGYVFKNDESLTITAAPSKVREVEAVHTQICKLLENGSDIRDILVVSPNIAAYRTAIFQVFDQSEKTTANGVHVRFAML
ncbi:MAG: exodeoxyribonuclease V subunit gamma, partial [Hallerella sp.]|nr:exodeoxyribonuclease V subunit gamma [Hallerella sp.]